MTSIPRRHLIDITSGHFSREDGQANLDELSKWMADQPAQSPLAIYVHGGLIDVKWGEETAELLYGDYVTANSLPSFFIWRTDLRTTFTSRLAELASDRVLWDLVCAVGRLAIAAIGAVAGAKDGDFSPELTLSPRELLDLDGEALASKFESHLPEHIATEEPLEATLQSWAERKLKDDERLQQSQRGIALARLGDSQGERGGFGDATEVESKLDQHVVEQIIAEGRESAETRSSGLFWTLIRYGAEIVVKVVHRFATGRDHGIYETVVEETLRKCYADRLGRLTWDSMKKNAAKPFDASKSGSGLECLRHLGDQFAKRRVVLIGHSAGSIFILHLLNSLDSMMPEGTKVDIVLLAPACTYGIFHEHLDVIRNRVNRLRVFGLKDDVERRYWEVTGLFRGSLLYMVSGMMEEEVDEPLLGMERYLKNKTTYAAIDAVADVSKYLTDFVWGPLNEGDVNDAEGRRTAAAKHGAFERDTVTRESIQYILKNGIK